MTRYTNATAPRARTSARTAAETQDSSTSPAMDPTTVRTARAVGRAIRVVLWVAGPRAAATGVAVGVWVPNIVSPHATWEYSCSRPLSRSRRVTGDVGVDRVGKRPQLAGLVQGPVWTVLIEIGLVLGEDLA